MHLNNLARLATASKTATLIPMNTLAPPPPSIPAGQQWRFYYFAGSQRIAMRYKDSGSTNAYTFFLTDHLGSTTLTMLPDGTLAGRMLYKAFGEERYTYGTTPTDYQFTGQLSQVTDTGLYYYGARWYDPAIGRFTQPDTIVPLESQGVQAWDRYAYVNNSPMNFNDPSGHYGCDDDSDGVCVSWTANYVLSQLGIATKGLTLKEQWDVADAAIYTGQKFAGEGGNPVETFKTGLGKVTIKVGAGEGPENSEQGNCITIAGSISCQHAMNIGNAVHEFFHIFDSQYKSTANDGEHLASDYLPMDYRDSPYTDAAFYCATFECLAHPPNLEGFDWTEQFGNMGQSWVLEVTNVDKAHFGFSKIGAPLREWMNAQMPLFLEKIRGVK